MDLINSINLIILKNKILRTNTAKKNNKDSIQKIKICQYYKNISYNIPKNILVILFFNKVKIKWECDNCIDKKKNKKYIWILIPYKKNDEWKNCKKINK